MEMLHGDEDSHNLQQLLETFGSVVSLQDIASAYCDAGCDISIAGDILCNLQASTSKTSSFEPKDEFVSTEAICSASLEDSSKEAQINLSRSKKASASMGLVSDMIGRGYDRSKLLNDATCKKTKPIKLNSDDFPISEIWKEEKAFPENTEKSETLRNDVEEFLFKMLGDGFSLNMSTIHQVVGQCGYDMNKSMDTLCDLSATTLEKCDDIVSIGSKKSPDLKANSSRDNAGSSKTNNKAADGLQKPMSERSKYELQREILESLFSHSRNDDEDEVILPLKENQRFRNIVDRPLQLPRVEHRTVITRPQATEMSNEEDVESYELLRKAVKEYWTTMKEYFKAATEAYVKGEHVKAHKLLEEGLFFMKKAREADEKSAQKLLQPRDDKEELVFDVHHFEPKQAIRFLKLQLNNFSGIPTIEFIRVIVGVNDDDAKGPRKRLIVKLLERDSIPWTEEENGRTLVIKVDEIDCRKLSFFKRSTSTNL